MIAAATHAVVLLGDIGEVQKVCEGTGDRQRRFNWHLPEESAEPIEVVVSVPRTLRQRTNVLDALIETVAAVLLERPSEQLAEQPDVFAQRLMGIRARLLCGNGAGHIG